MTKSPPDKLAANAETGGLTASRLYRGASRRLTESIHRLEYWVASGGRKLDLIDPGHVSFRRTLGRQQVGKPLFAADLATAVILAFGQSNLANECDPDGMYEPKHGVYNFNIFNGKCYVAKDPLLGPSGDRSNVATRLGDLLVGRGRYNRVLLVPVAFGGTYMSEWAPTGRMFPRLMWTLDQLGRSRIQITHAIWQQGEADSARPDSRAEDWMRNFRAMVDAMRSAGVGAPVYVAQCTVCSSKPNETIRSAQRQIVQPTVGILAGPDLDVIGCGERWDGCHLSAAGLDRAAELWFEALHP